MKQTVMIVGYMNVYLRKYEINVCMYVCILLEQIGEFNIFYI